MFDGMDAFDMDPNDIQDLPTERNPRPTPKGGGMSGMGSPVVGAPGAAATGAAVAVPQDSPYGPYSAGYQFDPAQAKANGGNGNGFGVKHVEQIFGAAAGAAGQYAQLQQVEAMKQIQAMKQQKAQADAAYQQQMRMLQSQAGRNGGMSPTVLALVIGGILVVGVLIYMSRR